MKTITRFGLFAVALLFAAVAFVGGSPSRGKVPALSELAFGIADVGMVADLAYDVNEFPQLASADVSPANTAAASVQAATLGDQLLVTNLAGAEHYAREPQRMTLAAVWRNSTHIKQPPAISVFAIPEPGGRASDVLAQLTSCNPDFRRT
jgi:hypothetical protein